MNQLKSVPVMMKFSDLSMGDKVVLVNGLNGEVRKAEEDEILVVVYDFSQIPARREYWVDQYDVARAYLVKGEEVDRLVVA